MNFNKYALISTFDKLHLSNLCKILEKFKIGIISTGSTAIFIREKGYKCLEISDITKFHEILDGRVKTLHPKIYSSILYRRNNSTHVKTFKKLKIPSIDFVIVNLYPFNKVIKKNKDINECIEMIDIGGVSLIRSAAKNFNFVTAICTPKDYTYLIKNLIKNNGETSISFRKKMAQKIFEECSTYDQNISNWFLNRKISIPNIKDKKIIKLKYGENPNQKSYFYPLTKNNFLENQIHGKKISYNNILDLDAGLNCILEFNQATCVIIKHNNPCGVACDSSISNAYDKTVEADTISAFGGIVLLNRLVNESLANKLNNRFFEVIAAKKFSKGALNILKRKQNLILINLSKLIQDNKKEIKSVIGGYIIQNKNKIIINNKNIRCVSKKLCSNNIKQDMIFALKVCKHVKSNAIVLAKNLQTIGIGAGQMNRSDATDIAIKKNILCKNGYVAASDAFFPFTDNLRKLKKHNCNAIIQPSGSLNDNKIIKFANDNKITLYFVNVRLFKH